MIYCLQTTLTNKVQSLRTMFMNNSGYIFNIRWFLVYFLICPIEVFPQIDDEIPTKKDSTTIVKSDTANLAIDKMDVFWYHNKKELGSLIAEDVGDFVKLLPEVVPMDLGSLGQFSPLSHRGATPQQGKILIDDQVWEEPIYGFINATNIPINIVEEMTYKGAGAFLPYGAQSMEGVIQVNTYNIQAVRPYSKIHFRTGDWGYSDFGIMFGIPVSQSSNFVVGGNRQEHNGFYHYDYNGIQASSKHAGSRIYSKLSYQPRAAFSLNYSAFINKDKAEIPATLQPDFIPIVSKASRKESRFDQMLSVKIGNLSSQNKIINGRLFISKIRQESSGDTLLFDNKNITFGAGVQYELHVGRHRLSAGGEIRFDHLTSAKLGNRDDQIGHIFVRDGFRITPKLELGIQGRLEKHDGYAAALNPSMHLYFDFSTNIKLWFGIQRAKRYPSFSERFWPELVYFGNPKLKPETGTALEVGMNVNKGKTFEFQSVIFTKFIQDWIGNSFFDPTVKIYGPINSGNRTISGLDFKFIWNYLPNGQFGFIGSYLILKEDESEKQLQVPEFNIYSYFELGRSFFQDYVFIKLRLNGRIFGKRFGPLYTNNPYFPENGERSANAILDGQVSFQFSDANLSVSMENIFRTQYQLVPGFFMPIRALRVKIEWEFWD